MMMKMKYGEGEEEDDNDVEFSWNNPPPKKISTLVVSFWVIMSYS